VREPAQLVSGKIAKESQLGRMRYEVLGTFRQSLRDHTRQGFEVAKPVLRHLNLL
jgi:hypothetical protein